MKKIKDRLLPLIIIFSFYTLTRYVAFKLGLVEHLFTSKYADKLSERVDYLDLILYSLIIVFVISFHKVKNKKNK